MDKVKLNNAQARRLIAQCEAELTREAKRLKLEARLKSLLEQAETYGFHINKKLFAHTIPKDSERFEFVDYQPMR